MKPALADDLFLLAHDLQTGKPRLPEPTLGIGLAGALLAELMFSGCVVVAQSQLLLGELAPPKDQLAEALFDQLGAQLFTQRLTVANWMETRRGYVVELVADRLTRGRLAVREEHRRLGRTFVRYRALSPTDVFMRGQRLATFLRNRMELTELDVVLAALAMLITGGNSLLELDEDGRDHLERLIPQLPIPLRELLAATDGAVSAVVRNPRA